MDMELFKECNIFSIMLGIAIQYFCYLMVTVCTTNSEAITFAKEYVYTCSLHYLWNTATWHSRV